MSQTTRKGLRWRLALLLWTGLSFIAPRLAAMDYTVETVPNVRLADRLNHVSDPDDIITPADEVRINRLLNVVEDSLGIEVAVVALSGIGDNDARAFATELFNYWGLGKKGEDNGLLIQLVTEPSRRSVVFETGYGIEGILPDVICYRLQQRYMIEDLKRGDYSAGMLKGVMAVSQYLLASDYERGEMAGGRGARRDGDPSLWIFALFAIGTLGIVALASYQRYRPRRCPRCGKKTFVCMGRQTLQEATRFSEGLVEDIYRCKNCGHTERHRHVTDRIRPGGGGFGGFGGSSGGGSWGGGSSGGGGSMSRF